MHTKGQRLPRYRRAPTDHLPLKLTDQDIHDFLWLYECRLLTSWHLRLVDPRSDQFVIRRSQKFFHHKYVSRIPTSSHNEVFLYAIANRGMDELTIRFPEKITRGAIDWDKKNNELKDSRSIAHTLMSSNFWVALHLDLKDHPHVALSPESPGNELIYAREGKPCKVKPDKSFTLIDRARGRTMHFFREDDRSTMPNERTTLPDKDFLDKLRGYWQFYKQEKEKARQGLPALAGFRVLVTCKTLQRAENLRAIAKKADNLQKGSDLYWFTQEQTYFPPYTDRERFFESRQSLFSPLWKTPTSDQFRQLLQ